MEVSLRNFTLDLNFKRKNLEDKLNIFSRYSLWILSFFLICISVASFLVFYQNHLALSYNDARSHLDIGRRVVEGLKPGAAQLGSVWLPLLHILMIPTIWNDFMWHSGLSGAVISMISFVGTGIFVYKFLKILNVGRTGRIFGVFVFLANLNVLYLTSTAMTEGLLLLTMTAGSYYLTKWARAGRVSELIKSSFWIMASTLTRYDGWFLFVFAAVLVVIIVARRRGGKEAEGAFFLFATLAGFGVLLWFLWNLVIFKDPFYFIYGPYSAYTQQSQLELAGELPTKGNLILSAKAYLLALFYNTYTYPVLAAGFGLITFLFDRKISLSVKIAGMSLFSAFLFNILALYLGHSVLFLPEIIGETWFNVRYGMMLVPSLAIMLGYLVDRAKIYRLLIIGLTLMIVFFALVNRDAVTIDDAVYGASQKNVYEVSTWLKENAGEQKGFILISAASHDAIIFSSGLPMKRFIHEGTGAYWDYAVENPEKWATWIVMRTYDMNDLTYKEINDAEGFKDFELVDHYPFADIYQLKAEYRQDVITEPILGKPKQ